MIEASLRLDRLLRVLPDVPELAVLREAMLRSSRLDPAMEWSSAGRYATFDKRVLVRESLEAVLNDARLSAVERVERLYDSAERLMAAAGEEDDAAVAEELIRLGESAEARESWRDAGACYALAASLSGQFADRTQLILTVRRLARVRMAAGDLDEARELYRTSLEQALSAGDVVGAVVALTGMGNALSFQGRWAGARVQYEDALRRCPPDEKLIRAQVQINLAMVSREQGRPGEAESRLTECRVQCWDELQPADRSGWYNTAGLLALTRGSYDEAERAFTMALAEAPGYFESAMVLDNMAELAICSDRLEDALAIARRAEHHALAAAAPRALAEIYTRLGRVFRLRRDANGVTFFEKALELCAGHRFLLTHASAYREYAAFRSMLGDDDEARAYRERAAALFRDLGTEIAA